MATKTNKLGLSKAELTDAVRSTLVANNGNFDIIDDQITRLKANQPKGTASGTEIVVEDSAEMESILRVSGNSEQDSRSGRNLVDVTAVNKTEKGITIIVNEDKSITINGTNTETTTVFFKIANDITLPAGTYTLANYNTKVSNDNGFIFYDDNHKFERRNVVSATFDTEVIVKPYIKVTAGATVNNETIYPTIIEGSYTADTLPPYEPYGAMPSPDYPSEIRSVKSKSDNLIDLANVTTHNEGATGIIQGNKLTVTNSYTSRWNSFWLYFPTSPNTTYTASIGKMIGNFSPAVRIAKNASGISENIIAMLYPNDNKFTFTTDNETTQIGLFFYPNYNANTTESGATATFEEIQITKGATALPYQPNGYVPVEAKVEGKNKLKLTKGTFNFKGVTVTIAEDGLITLNGTITENYPTVKLTNGFDGVIALEYVSTSEWIKEDIDVIGDFTLETTYIGGTSSGSTPVVSAFNQSGERLTFMMKGTNLENVNTKTKLACVALYLGNPSYTYNNYQFYLMIEQGTKTEAPNYTPYVEPTIISLPLGDIELRSTPDGTRDTFERVDGVWNKVENVGSVVLDGVNNKFNYKSSSTSNTIWMNTPPQATIENGGVMSNRFKGVMQNLYSKDEIGVYLEAKGIRCAFGLNSELTTLELANNWLSSNPTQVDYVLATPIYTPIIDETLIQALDKLENLILHKGYNRITVTSVNGVKAYLDLSYVKDINIVLNNIMTKLGGV